MINKALCKFTHNISIDWSIKNNQATCLFHYNFQTSIIVMCSFHSMKYQQWNQALSQNKITYEYDNNYVFN